VRELRRTFAVERDALRRVRAEKESTSAPALIELTERRLGIIAFALVAPWVWLIVLDSMARRRR
jgi:hypothetical protein